jgi:signal transduction histidine kinase
MDGVVEVQSEVGRGSTFSVRLPASETDPRAS